METPPSLSAPTDEHVREALDRLVRALDPLRVIVFGSVARRQAVPGSDLDLLVVLDHVTDKRAAPREARRVLAPLGVPKDVIVTCPDEIERRGWIVGTVLHEALQGRTVYDRAGRDAP